MMNLLKQTYQEHHKKTKIKLSDSVEQLKSTCPDATFKNIREFLKATVTELCSTYDLRCCKKRTLDCKYTFPQALHSHNTITTSSNATATDRVTSLTAITTVITVHSNHNTPSHPQNIAADADATSCTTRYWRRNSHNI